MKKEEIIIPYFFIQFGIIIFIFTVILAIYNQWFYFVLFGLLFLPLFYFMDYRERLIIGKNYIITNVENPFDLNPYTDLMIGTGNKNDKKRRKINLNEIEKIIPGSHQAMRDQYPTYFFIIILKQKNDDKNNYYAEFHNSGYPHTYGISKIVSLFQKYFDEKWLNLIDYNKFKYHNLREESNYTTKYSIDEWKKLLNEGLNKSIP